MEEIELAQEALKNPIDQCDLESLFVSWLTKKWHRPDSASSTKYLHLFEKGENFQFYNFIKISYSPVRLKLNALMTRFMVSAAISKSLELESNSIAL